MILADEDERLHIRNDLDVAQFVEAGAGTGKTTELVSRIFGLVASGRADIESIVAITFTEEAANELRERVRSRLEAALVGAGSDAVARCRAALRGIDEAPIQTIHGFARRILVQFATEAQLPMTFEVADSVTSRQRFDKRWREFVGRAFASESSSSSEVSELLRTAVALGMNINQLRTLYEKADAHWHQFETEELEDFSPKPQPHQAALKELLEQLSEALSSLDDCKASNDLMSLQLENVVAPYLARLHERARSGNAMALIELLVDTPPLKRGPGRKENWDWAALASARESIVRAEAARQEFLEVPRQWVLSGLIAMAGRFAREAATTRCTRGELNFHDLLVLARDLTVRNANIRAKLAETYSFILVDEFQDTDPVQAELLESLSGAGESSSRFTVGDPKQSIYRFRGADLAQYESARSNYGAMAVSLSTNFRTLPAVLDWVDATFRDLLTDRSQRLVDEWTSLRPVRNDNEVGVGSVEIIGKPLPKPARSEEVRVVEADESARCIADMKRRGLLIGGNQTVRYRDIALLIRSRRALPALEISLRKSDVPYRIESRALLWSTQEIRDLTAVIGAIADPTDDLSLIAALRSPIFGCGDDDLYRWKSAGGTWDYRSTISSSDDLASPVAVAMQLLCKWNEQQWVLGVSRLIEQVIGECRYLETLSVHSRKRERWNRVRFFCDQAQVWEDSIGGSLNDFVAWSTDQTTGGADAVETVIPEADDDAVRVMTIHASKGLEFPVVVVCGLGWHPKNTDSARLTFDDEGVTQVRLGKKDLRWETTGFASTESKEMSDELAEGSRLLYVAATRARDHLVASVYCKESDKTSLAYRLWQACNGSGAGERWFGSVDDSIAPDPLPKTSEEEHQKRHAAIANGSSQVAVSATAFAGETEAEVPNGKSVYSGVDAVMWRQQQMSFGTAVHRTLELLDFERLDSLEAVARVAAAENDVGHYWRDVACSARLAIESEVFKEAVESGRWWREVRVSAPTKTIVIEGYVDLIYESPDGLTIVDFKTDSVDETNGVEKILSRYEMQLLAYTEAVSIALDKPVKKAGLLFISPKLNHAHTAWLSLGDSKFLKS